MLKARTYLMGVILVSILILTVRIVAAKTEALSNASSNQASALRNQDASPDQYKNNRLAFRSILDECFDVPLWQDSTCHKTSQASRTYRSPLDECFDVPLSEARQCRNASQASIP